jgi:hypothetical protein
MLNFVYLRSSRLNFLHFWLDSCIVNKGEKFELKLACCTHLEGFQVVSVIFELGQFPRWHQPDRWRASVWPVQFPGAGRSCPPVWLVRVTGQSWAIAAALFHEVVRMHSSRGSCIGSGGACMCAGGALCGFSSFGLVVCALCLSIVLSQMCRVVALA